MSKCDMLFTQRRGYSDLKICSSYKNNGTHLKPTVLNEYANTFSQGCGMSTMCDTTFTVIFALGQSSTYIHSFLIIVMNFTVLIAETEPYAAN